MAGRKLLPVPDPPFQVRTSGHIAGQPHHSTPGSKQGDEMLTAFLAGRGWLSSGKIYRPLYQPVEWLFRLAAQVIRVTSAVLEGEAGILWAFVLLVFGLLFLQQ